MLCQQLQSAFISVKVQIRTLDSWWMMLSVSPTANSQEKSCLSSRDDICIRSVHDILQIIKQGDCEKWVWMNESRDCVRLQGFGFHTELYFCSACVYSARYPTASLPALHSPPRLQRPAWGPTWWRDFHKREK